MRPNNNNNWAIVDSILRPRCALPFPFPADNAFFNGEENPFPAIRDAAYRQLAVGGSSHRHRQHEQQIWQRSRIWFRRYPCGQTDRQTHRHTHHNNLATAPAGEVTSGQKFLTRGRIADGFYIYIVIHQTGSTK